MSRWQKTKRLTGSSRLLSQRAVIQTQVAQAEAGLRAGRAFMFQTVQDVWNRVVAGHKIGQRDRALLRLSACHATSASTQAIDLMYQAAGTAAIWDTSPLQRHFRDVHVPQPARRYCPTDFRGGGKNPAGGRNDISDVVNNQPLGTPSERAKTTGRRISHGAKS